VEKPIFITHRGVLYLRFDVHELPGIRQSVQYASDIIVEELYFFTIEGFGFLSSNLNLVASSQQSGSIFLDFIIVMNLPPSELQLLAGREDSFPSCRTTQVEQGFAGCAWTALMEQSISFCGAK
jgi:hypothetical protein